MGRMARLVAWMAAAVAGCAARAQEPAGVTAAAGRAGGSLTFHLAVVAEQIVGPRESPLPRRPLGGVVSSADDHAGVFEDKLVDLDKVGVDAFWLYGFRAAEGGPRDIRLLAAAKAKLERLGKKAHIVCEPLGHPGPPPPADSPLRQAPPGRGWRYRIDAEGEVDWGSACLDETVLRDLTAATRAFRDAGFTKVFFDDDLRLGHGRGRDRWGDTPGGCFCDHCLADFNRRQGTDFSRRSLRDAVLAPEPDPALLDHWLDYNCDKITTFMKAMNLPGLQVGIMVMCNGGRNHGIDLAAIQQSVPDVMVRVGEGHFDDASFDHPGAREAVARSIRSHMAFIDDDSRLFSENTVFPWPQLRPENMAAKLELEVENGLRNIMLMPPQLLDAPPYWEAMAAARPRLRAIIDRATAAPRDEGRSAP